jgi:hypothetical protein
LLLTAKADRLGLTSQGEIKATDAWPLRRIRNDRLQVEGVKGGIMSSAGHWLLAGVAVTISGSAIASETVIYTYDARGRLTAATRSGTVNNGVASNYTYDKADNRANVTVTGAATNGSAGGTTMMSQTSAPVALDAPEGSAPLPESSDPPQHTDSGPYAGNNTTGKFPR